MTAAEKATAVIAAAGSGERLGAGPKALVELAGRPMLAWSLRAFASARSVGAAIVAAPPGAEDAVATVSAGVAGLETTVVAGGDSRSESVSLALAQVATDVVAVHDAARPLVTPALVDLLVGELKASPEAAGAIAAARLVDTVKRAREADSTPGETPRGAPTVAETLDRGRLWAAQTPQVFRREALREALRLGPADLARATDDAMLVERAGGRVLIRESPHPNLKVTTALDLRVAGLLLARASS